jgi:predicted AAA+ superfamily ATPase
MYPRLLSLEEIHDDSIFLWGARQTGKSTLLKALFPKARYYDLLNSNLYRSLSRNPSLLREQLALLPSSTIVIIDEVQKVPDLLDEVHWLIQNKGLHFILCGSSARKLRRSGANLLGGRALSCTLFPLTSAEIQDFDIERALNYGTIPPHYLAKNPIRRLQAYIDDYIQQEIVAESVLRNLSAFTRFLEVAALSDTEIVNYTNIAAECGVTAKTVKEYFAILEETLFGFMLPAYTHAIKRRVVQSPKFYYFDVGIPNYLLNRTPIRADSTDYGHAFEHLMMQELRAYLGYHHSRKRLSYWRTSSGLEVDCIIGNAEVAIEFKSSTEVRNTQLKGLRAFTEEHPDVKCYVVSRETFPRLVDGVEIWPIRDFLAKLWMDEIITP